jgi:uncharacterized damage-inducible protein DinB
VSSDEREQLLAYLAQQRYVLRLAAYGLDDERARRSPSSSALSIGGLIKHVAAVEEFWIGLVAGRQEPARDEADHSAGFRLESFESLASVLERYAAAAARTEEVVRSVPVDRAVQVPHDVPWFPKDLDHWTVRWVLLHLITETARHAGHADIVGETLDGATAFPLMAAAEGWEPTPWLTPWSSPDAHGTGGAAGGAQPPTSAPPTRRPPARRPPARRPRATARLASVLPGQLARRDERGR